MHIWSCGVASTHSFQRYTMNSHCYDSVCRLSIVDTTDAATSKNQKFKSGVNAVLASSRLDTKVYGRRWNDLTPEGQQRIIAEKRKKRSEEKLQLQREEEARVTLSQVQDTVRRNSVAGAETNKRRLSRRGTDLSLVEGELVWTKAWLLSPDGSLPDLTSAAKYHNRRRDSSYLSQDLLQGIGVVYMKLPTSSLDQLNSLCDERGYTSLNREEFCPSSDHLEVCPRVQRPKPPHIRSGTASSTTQVNTSLSCCRGPVTSTSEMITTSSSVCSCKKVCVVKICRVHVPTGDLLIIPPGIFHRGTLDQAGNVSLLKCFMGENQVVFREGAQTQLEVRAQYLASRKRGSILQDNMFVTNNEDEE
eukprot:TRINITY_DN19285_c0_g1_i1.p1 TRINITY_DN19285_c0_g1~~TRINITY_DN19285_c0_g1_i1.p1  ORF type:complete len:361 (+),score=40.50 TRINITY_DN19285_c0_g1_i1:209-1291(+)